MHQRKAGLAQVAERYIGLTPLADDASPRNQNSRQSNHAPYRRTKTLKCLLRISRPFVRGLARTLPRLL